MPCDHLRFQGSAFGGLLAARVLQKGNESTTTTTKTRGHQPRPLWAALASHDSDSTADKAKTPREAHNNERLQNFTVFL